jgi:crotonobetainyl-CoA:carnitine CoA-transferase CaiB-like acyl-CoA transferase
MQSSSNLPLAGLKILDLSRVVSGPFCTMILGDLGADVVKVEEPKLGDESRSYGPPFQNGESSYFLSVNRNKRSIAIDLKSSDGIALVLQLVETADVFVENFRPGTADRLGLGFEQLRSRNATLVYCSISGFGRTGPDATRPGYDLIVQGEAGLMDITGHPDGPPTKVGTPIADLVAGLYASQAITAALLARRVSGCGRRVDIAMSDSVASLLAFNAGIYFATGESSRRRGNFHPTISPYETFEAADGWINIGVANDKFWTLFCDAIGRPELLTDSRFATPSARVTHRLALVELIAPILRRESRDAWVARLGKAGVPCGAIRTVAEVCEATQLVSRGMIFRMQHPTVPEICSIATPFRFDDQTLRAPLPPPLLDQHRAEILRDWLKRSPSPSSA